jgi:uncharacterized coiled-coil protein SlyX
MTRGAMTLLLALAIGLGMMGTAWAQDQAAAIEELKKEMRELRQEVNKKQKKIEELENRLDAVQKTVNATAKEPVKAATAKIEPTTPQAALDQAVQAVQRPKAEKAKAEATKPQEALDQAVKTVQASQEQAAKPSLWSYKAGKAELRLIDISLDAMVAGGSSSATDQQLQQLQGGGHDPRKRGFTVQQVELSASGAVDPYFNAEAHIVYFLDPITGESQVELEEAFLTTQKLPYKLQFKGGTFLTEFGRLNPTHPHAWKWLDQPVINTRLFGPDGMRGPGFRVSWLTPLPWYCQLYLGMQNANGETMSSFLANSEFAEERPIGGYPFSERPVKALKDLAYLARIENSWDLSETVTSKLGFSGVYGPNYTGPRGDTWIYGTDLVVKWRPALNYQGWPFLLLESELMGRTFRALPQDNITIPGNILQDWGFYAQLLWGFYPRWAVGLRGEYASGARSDVGIDPTTGTWGFVSRNTNPFRDNRTRISPLLMWQLSEFSRLRLQYNHDWAAHLPGKTADTIWAGVEFLYGAHPAHKY